MDIDMSKLAIGPETTAGEKRYERIQELSRAGRASQWWVGKALNEADKPYPSPAVRSHPAWARAWDRPRSATWDSYASIDRAQEEWDRHDAMNTRADEARQEREERNAEAQRQRETEDAAKREQEAQQMKAELKARYLAMPGTSEADFEAEYPTLLADHRRREMERNEREADASAQAMRRLVRSSF